jgi:ABC-type multidrug transport system fused ATPase/permease subunit
MLSGGQRQRIAIARELYKSPKLLILDEATSSLDSETENLISESLNKLKGSLTIILVAHRLSTIKNCDLVYVLDNGSVIEQGSYDELSRDQSSKLNYFIKKQSLD